MESSAINNHATRNNRFSGNSSLTILIIEKDKYYAEGLRQVLIVFFSRLNIRVFFTNDIYYRYRANIIFCGSSLSESGLLSEIAANPETSNTRFFLIQNPDSVNHHSLTINQENIRVISRNLSVDKLVNLIKPMFSSIQSRNALVGIKPITEALTRREREVLESLALGMTNCSIANMLRISVKTVSNHKRTAMAKLNFRNSTELHYWFLRGGLAELTQQNSEAVHPAINIARELSSRLSTMLNTSRLIAAYPALLKQVYAEGNITSEIGSDRRCVYQDKLMLSKINSVSNLKIHHHV